MVTCGLVLSSLLRWEHCASAAPGIRTFFLQLSSCWWLVQIVAKNLAEHSGLRITLKLQDLDFCFFFFFFLEFSVSSKLFQQIETANCFP